jgi:hypothetical protein
MARSFGGSVLPGPLVAYALARFPPAPITVQARRVHPALPARAGREAAVWTGLVARDQVRRIPRDRP